MTARSRRWLRLTAGVACALAALLGMRPGSLRAEDRASASSPGSPRPVPAFSVQSQFGDEASWTAAYLDRAARVLVEMFDNPSVAPPPTIRVELIRDPAASGLGGFATPDSLGFTANVWPREKHRLWLLAHELSNLLAAHYAGGGGFPADWWADGRSPFPEFVACLVMEKLGFAEEARWRRGTQAGKPDHVMYWDLHRRYGFGIFSRMLKLLRADGVVLGQIGAPWPQPDRVRTLYAIAYLSLGAGSNLAALVREHGIGQEPEDWRRVHPDVPFRPYLVSSAETEQIVWARNRLFEGARGPDDLDPLREAYRAGRYDEVLEGHGVVTVGGSACDWSEELPVSAPEDSQRHLEAARHHAGRGGLKLPPVRQRSTVHVTVELEVEHGTVQCVIQRSGAGQLARGPPITRVHEPVHARLDAELTAEGGPCAVALLLSPGSAARLRSISYAFGP